MNHSHDEMETQPPASLSTLPVEMLLSIARHLQPRDVYHLGLASRRLFESVARPFDSTDPLRMRLWKAVDGDKKPGDFQDILRHIFIQPSNDVFKLLLENKSGPGADSAELCNAFEEFGRMCQSTMAMEPQCTERSCAYNPFHDRSLNPDYNYYWFDIGAVAASTL